MVTEATGAAVIVIWVELETPPAVAVIVALPTDAALTRPAPETVALLGVSLAQVTAGSPSP